MNSMKKVDQELNQLMGSLKVFGRHKDNVSFLAKCFDTLIGSVHCHKSTLCIIVLMVKVMYKWRYRPDVDSSSTKLQHFQYWGSALA